MRIAVFDGLLSFVACLALLGCEKETPAMKADSTKGAPATAASVAASPAEAAPTGCKAGSDKPALLGTVVGDVHGFAHDALNVYYTSWEMYGGRGEVGVVRKDGKGSRKVGALQLEPRGLTVDQTDLYFTSGIRLMAIPKSAGDVKILAQQFSAQQIAVHADEVYGVPGDYGPYDRIAKISTKGGDTTELTSSKRPGRNDKPVGFSRIAVDASGIYVTDTGGNRVLKYALKGEKPKIIAGGVDKPFDLEVVGPDVYFSLFRKGDLMVTPKGGGAAKRLASGLTTNAHIAGDEKGVYTTLAGKDEAQVLAKVNPKSGEITPIAPVPAPQTVDAIAVDGDCMYWAQRVDSSKTIVYALAR